ncbi:glycosyltransferase [Candidatus Micrarchaeota archaeon]|nr:glycosyltransferase [Candidatus Micrarchaeota archaeon]
MVDISIVIPTLDEEGYIENTLKSIKKQKTSMDFEIIIADGYSKDKTVEIAEKYADKIVFEKKKTISAGRVKGMKSAGGKLLVSTDADVWVNENWLEKLVKPLGEYSACIGKFCPLDGNIAENLFSEAILTPSSYILSKTGMYLAGANNLAFTKEVYMKVGGFNPELVTAEDTDLIKRISKFGKIKYNKDAVVYVSMRRIREWGYRKYALFHANNFVLFHLKNEANGNYEPIR